MTAGEGLGGGRSSLDWFMDPVAVMQPVRDGSGRLVDLEFVDASDAALEALGTTEDQVPGRSFGALMGAPVPAGVLEMAEQVIATGQPQQVRDSPFTRVVTGVPGWFDVRLAPTRAGLLVTWRDVTELHRRAEAAAESEAMYRLLAEESADVLVRFDLDGAIRYVSPNCRSLLGYEPEELLGTPVYALMHPDDLDVAARAAERVLDAGVVPEAVRGRMRCRDGGYRWVSTTGRLVAGPEGRPFGVVASWRNAEADVREARALAALATTDELTGLLTRREGWARLTTSLTDDRRTARGVAVLFCDLDDFKGINDRHGHRFGDVLLARVAERVLGCVRQDDYVVRLGGDELLIVLHRTGDLPDVAAVAEKVRASVARPLVVEGRDLSITVSIGGSLARPDEQVSELVRRADEAMYLAKDHGGDRVIIEA